MSQTHSQIATTSNYRMVDDELVQRIEESFDKDDDELQAVLPELLAEIEGNADELVKSNPAIVSRILDRMGDMEIAPFVSEHPDTADQFQELLWSGVRTVADGNEAVEEQINEDIAVNFEAEDCPMTGHVEVVSDDTTVTGGAGVLDDPDISITGPADVLVGLITGSVDPIQGFMQQQYQMDGPVQKGTRLAPIMNTLSEQAQATQ
ncbi:SCP2 sterol-binding domain-containing protein [Halocatena halophila]|uniref:SCP2 sterol-binding domain-containing protein n=1 Tax=Halocatena halophila TaxID=2814576 RepID=UPI002ED5A453